MGWFWLILLLLAVLVVLGLALRHSAARVMPVAAVLLLGALGYGWQGHPQMAGAPAPTPPSSTSDEAAVEREADALARKTANGEELFALSLALEQKGDYRMASALLGQLVRREPTNADHWVGLGNALVLHAGGLVTPAANLAFDRALVLAPEHPGPAFFKGLGLAQMGQYDEAAKMWRDLLARSPADAPWRGDLEQRLAMIAQVTGDSEAPTPPMN
jgi:cytochrome c-type biogenesis protein CcmH/NrfG